MRTWRLSYTHVGMISHRRADMRHVADTCHESPLSTWQTCELERVSLTFESSSTGEFNVNGLTRMLAEGEMRDATWRPLNDTWTARRGHVDAPNVLRVRVGVLRGARYRLSMARNSALPVYVELRARGMCLRAKARSAGSALYSPSNSPSDAEGPEADAYFYVELVLPLTDPSTIIHVRDETQPSTCHRTSHQPPSTCHRTSHQPPSTCHAPDLTPATVHVSRTSPAAEPTTTGARDTWTVPDRPVDYYAQVSSREPRALQTHAAAAADGARRREGYFLAV